MQTIGSELVAFLRFDLYGRIFPDGFIVELLSNEIDDFAAGSVIFCDFFVGSSEIDSIFRLGCLGFD